jgi:general secretion pathway protein G
MNKIKLISRRGFTLLEILLVVVIIGFLVSVAVVKLSGQSAKAKVVATQNQIDSFKTALGVYELDNGLFPSTEQGLQALLTPPSGTTLPNWKGPYLDPPVIRADPWGHAYIYKYPGVKIPNGYDLSSPGPNGIEGDDDDIGNWQ